MVLFSVGSAIFEVLRGEDSGETETVKAATKAKNPNGKRERKEKRERPEAQEREGGDAALRPAQKWARENRRCENWARKARTSQSTQAPAAARALWPACEEKGKRGEGKPKKGQGRAL